MTTDPSVPSLISGLTARVGARLDGHGGQGAQRTGQRGQRHATGVARIDHKIALLQQRHAEEEHGRRMKPPPPDWIAELGIGVGRPPTQVHRGTCHMAGKRRHPIGQDEARRLLADGTSACTHCRPDADLGILDSAQGRPRAGSTTATQSSRPTGSRRAGVRSARRASPPPRSMTAPAVRQCHVARNGTAPVRRGCRTGAEPQHVCVKGGRLHGEGLRGASAERSARMP
ncbi:DUF6233 domain-containing protein [Streptomyces sp. NPDC002671]